MKFSTKLSLSLAITILFITIIISFLIFKLNTKTLEKQIRDQYENNAFHTLNKIDRMLFERLSDIKMMSTDPIIRSEQFTPVEITERLIKYRNVYKTYVSISFFDVNWISIADTSGLHIGKKHPRTEYWKALMAGTDTAMDITYSETLNYVVFHFAQSVRDKQGMSLGTVVARMPVHLLHNIADEAVPGNEKDIRLDLIDKEKLILYSNYNRKGILKEKILNKVLIKEIENNEQRRVVRHMFQGEDTISICVREQGYLDYKGNNWFLLIHVPTRLAFAPAVKLRNSICIVMLLFTIFLVGTVYFLIRNFSKPIVTLRNVMDEVGKGRFDTKIDIRTKDDLGELSVGFERMLHDLKKTTVSKDYVDSIIHHMKDSLIVLTPGGLIKTVNRATLNLLGYTEKELIHKPVEFIMKNKITVADQDTLKSCQTVYNEENILISKSGKEIPVLLSASLMQNQEKVFRGLVCVAHDISTFKKTEQDREHLLSELEKANQELKDFAYVVSHDLKAPLRSISQLTQWIAEDYTEKIDDEGKEQINLLLESTKRMHDMIEGVLQYSRVGRVENKPERVSTQRIVEDVITSLMPPRQIHIHTAEKMPEITIDPVQIYQVFQNLIGNAIKFIDKPKGEIEIGYYDMNKYWVFFVRDNGIGIEEQYFERIFQIFHTLRTNDQHESTGVGLAVVKKIVEQNGGKVWVKSGVAKGSIFYFLLPKTQPGKVYKSKKLP